MTNRRYQLLCPIARALDAVGDRWALLILRDLHAGPARFGELESGLGIATNLLSARLGELVESGLVRRVDDQPRSPYMLTDLGRRTEDLLWELARFGAALPREPEPRPPGNLRTILIPLRMILRAVPDRPDVRVLLDIDGESFLIDTHGDDVAVSYQPDEADTDVVLRTSYETLLDVSEGLIDFSEFAERSAVVTGGDRVAEVLAMFRAATAQPGV